MLPFVFFFPKFLINSIYTQMSCHELFLMGYNEFGILITNCTSAINIFDKNSQGVIKTLIGCETVTEFDQYSTSPRRIQDGS
jgi:hypothetical protein